MDKLVFLSLCMTSAWLLQAQTWQSRIAGFSYSVNGSQVYAINDQVAWATGVEWDSDGITFEHTGLSRTVSAGNGWESVTFPTQEQAFLINVSALDALRAWVLVAMRPETPQEFYRLFHTIDGGITWDTQTIFLPTTPAFIHMWDESVGVVVSDPDPDGFRIRRTTDGGTTWTPVGNLPPALFDEYVQFNMFEAQGDDIWAATLLGRVLHSADRGLTWEIIESPLNDLPPFSIDVSDDHQLYLVFYDAFVQHGDTRIYRKQLPDGPWLNLSEQVTTYFPYTLKAVPGSAALLFTTYDWIEEHWLTRVSYNEGLSWITVDSTTNATYTDFYNAETGYASQENFTGGTTRIYRYVGSPLVGLLSQKPLQHATLSVSPNPASTSSVIHFESAVVDDYKVLVHDMQGHLLHSSDQYGTSVIQDKIDISSWPSGMYTITVTSGEGILSEVMNKL